MSSREVRSAVVFGPRDIRIATRPRAQLEPGELRVAVEQCGISERDVLLWARPPEAAVPLQLGSEIVGTVTEVGRDVDAWGRSGKVSVGTRVMVRVPSGELVGAQQRQVMGLADEVVADWQRCWPVSTQERFAVLAEPAARVLALLDGAHGERGPEEISRRHYVLVGAGLEAVLVMMRLWKSYDPGSVTVVDPRSDALQLATRLGATHTATPRGSQSVVQRATRGERADVVLELTGTPEGFEIAQQSVRRDGKVLRIELARVDEARMEAALDWLGLIDLTPIMGRSLPLELVGMAFAEAERGGRKVVVTR